MTSFLQLASVSSILTNSFKFKVEIKFNFNFKAWFSNSAAPDRRDWRKTGLTEYVCPPFDGDIEG